jgi:transcriptional regulator with XRE-family HTH domain
MRRPYPEQDARTSAGAPSFTAWLQQRLAASRLSQRQLADKAGVDHSTISRLLNGARMPSLRTATSLALALGAPDPPAKLEEMTKSTSWRSRPAEVEYALRADESLTDAQIRQIMDYYLVMRRGRPAAPAAKTSGSRAPVPIVVEMPKEGPTGSGRHPGRIHHRAG